MRDASLAWDRIGRETLADCRIFRLHRDRARSPRSNEEQSFFTLQAPDWVNVVALTEQDDVVMVRQFRHGSRSTTLEIPGGMVDPGESPVRAAGRELLEETGYAAQALDLMGVVNPNPALFGNRCHTFCALGARRVAPLRNDGAEETRVQLVPRVAVPGLMARGEIDHALVVAAFHWHALRRGAC